MCSPKPPRRCDVRPDAFGKGGCNKLAIKDNGIQMRFCEQHLEDYVRKATEQEDRRR